MTLGDFAAEHFAPAKICILPEDLTIELAGSDLILYYKDKEKNKAFLETIPHDQELYHFFVQKGAEYIYLGGRYFNTIDIANRCIIEGHGWKPQLEVTTLHVI